MSTALPPLATQRARLAVAEAQYSELLARNVRLNIVAPAAGLLLERNVEPGQNVSAGSLPLFLIAKGGEMELSVRRRICCSAGSIPPRSCGRVGWKSVNMLARYFENAERNVWVSRADTQFDPALCQHQVPAEHARQGLRSRWLPPIQTQDKHSQRFRLVRY